MKKILFSLMAGGLLAAPALADDKKIPRQPSPKGAKVMIIYPRNGKTVKSPVRIAFGLKGMGVCPAGLVLPDGKPMPNTGHHHLLVDTDKLPSMALPMVASKTLLHFGAGQTEVTLDLPPGKHTLQLVFADFAHIAHNPPVVSKKITITVGEGGKKKK